MTEIDFGEYLSEDERRAIVVDEYRQAVRRAVATKNDVERFVGNVAYGSISDLVDEALGEDAAQVIADKVATIIRNLTAYTVFQRADRFTRDKDSAAQVLLDQAVNDNKGMIVKRVKRIINEVGQSEVRWALKEAVDNAFNNLDKENSND